MTEHNKLVRDNIPALIREDGRQCEVETLDDAAYRRALLAKLVEEAQEAAAAGTRDELVTELADLFEVVDALLADHDISPEAVLMRKVARRRERGGFEERIWLTRTSEG